MGLLPDPPLSPEVKTLKRNHFQFIEKLCGVGWPMVHHKALFYKVRFASAELVGFKRSYLLGIFF